MHFCEPLRPPPEMPSQDWLCYSIKVPLGKEEAKQNRGILRNRDDILTSHLVHQYA